MKFYRLFIYIAFIALPFVAYFAIKTFVMESGDIFHLHGFNISTMVAALCLGLYSKKEAKHKHISFIK